METQQSLVDKSRKQRFLLGKREFISQQPNALKERYRVHSVVTYLPQFFLIWDAIEHATGHAWKCTSYIRDSPSHRRGQAFDLAPDIAPSAEHAYAVNNNSDPVLYKRARLIKQLQTLRNFDASGTNSNSMGIFLEPDHLHIQVLQPFPRGQASTRVIKWQQPKPVYPDTMTRMQLPAYI